MEPSIAAEDIRKLIECRHEAPHRVLGPHRAEHDPGLVVRAFLPYAARASVSGSGPSGPELEMERIHPDGLFEATIPGAKRDFHYQFVVTDNDGNTLRFHDPYSFTKSTLSTPALEQFAHGTHPRLFDLFGAQPMAQGGTQGINFAVWAPNAHRVSVVGTFNHWDGRCHPMRFLEAAGVWELFIPDIGNGEMYKYEIRTRNGEVVLRTDPFAFCTEARPKTAAIIGEPSDPFAWGDADWLQGRRATAYRERPLSVYVLDLDAQISAVGVLDRLLSYRELATTGRLTAVKEAGFTHLELCASTREASFFAPDRRYGMPVDLMAFVEACHQQGLGVIVNAIPSRFPETMAALAWFDGTPLYEQSAPATAGTFVFNAAKGEVRSFLVSNAFFWVEHYHVDGLLSDAVACSLYREALDGDGGLASTTKLLVREPFMEPTIAESEVTRLLRGRHDDPYAILGPHHLEAREALAIRALVPQADQMSVVLEGLSGVVYPMQRSHRDGLFETLIPGGRPHSAYRFQVIERGGRAYDLADPYSVTALSFTDYDQHLFAHGNHYEIYRKLGAHRRVQGNVSGVGFAVWAPNADGVSVVGPFNRWDGRRHPMKRHGGSGVWEVFVPGLGEGELYKYEIRASNGDIFLKSDPYAFLMEVPPDTASIVYESEGAHAWKDDEWMNSRRKIRFWEQPVAIYEVHLGSWMRSSDNHPLSYQELARKLIPYVKRMGFTHIELLPIAEHPYEPSWGYQVSNFYAPTSRNGQPADLMAFVDGCHRNRIGVILDWVPGHFPKDAHGLAWFDGTCLYEHADPRRGEHREWGTLIFNYGRHEVENFLIANALFWLDTYHFDGLRVDAVASMLYLDYSRPASGEWMPNRYGGNENLEAIEFLKHTNAVVHERFPGVLMIAEESTAWPAVSRPIDQGGLGFGFKWNMGWMHDVLAYMSTPPEERKFHHHKLTFGIQYAFHENFILSLSHDEVVHLKGSLLNKMPGDEWERFANLRLLFAFMYAHPGKKLSFMGGEFGQLNEWSHAKGLDWELLKEKAHERFARFIEDLNRLYRLESAFFEVDFKSAGFEWLDVDSSEESVIVFLRKAKDPRNSLLFAFNFSRERRPKYRIGVPYPVFYTELFNTDRKAYGGLTEEPVEGGAHAEEVPWHGQEFSLVLSIPALSAQALKPLPAETASRRTT